MEQSDQFLIGSHSDTNQIPTAATLVATGKVAVRRLEPIVDVLVRLELVEPLAVGLASLDNVLDHADVTTVASIGLSVLGSLLVERVLEHGDHAGAVGTTGETFEAAVVLAARRDGITVAGVVDRSVGALGDEVGGDLEAADELALGGKFDDRGAVFVRDEDVAVGAHGNTLGVEAAAEDGAVLVEQLGVLAVERLAGGVLEHHRRLERKVGDGAGFLVDVDAESVEPGLVGEETATRAAIGEGVVGVGLAVVPEVRAEAAETVAIGALGLAGEISGIAGNLDAVDVADERRLALQSRSRKESRVKKGK